MTTFNPHIAADPAAKEATVPQGLRPETEAAPQELPKQFRTARKQHVTFSQEQADAINAQLDLMAKCYGKRISVNHLVRQATLEKARRALREGEENHGW